ncbi:MAG: ATP-binding protein, partial [Cyanobacteria bacterium P01_H01_bin.15]
GVAGGVAYGVAGGVAGGVAYGVAGGVAGGVAYGVAVGVAGGVAASRFEAWTIGLLLLLRPRKNRPIPASTAIPVPFLTQQIRYWLRQDWVRGIDNVNELLRYTLQFIPVNRAVNQILAETPSPLLVERLTKLCEHPFDWKLVQVSSASLINLKSGLSDEVRLDTPAHALSAGFWCLHKKDSATAVKAFEITQEIPHGEELYVLAQTLDHFIKAENISAIADLTPLDSAPTPQLRPNTWNAIAHLSNTIHETITVQQSRSIVARSSALNRALGHLDTLQKSKDSLPEAERDLILQITETWQKALLAEAAAVGEQTIDKPIPNPYTIGDPVLGNKFIGRNNILRQIEELWSPGNPFQSIVLFGHRRMGKTSILRNLSTILDADINVAYINLLRSKSAEDLPDFLIAIADKIAAALNIPGPDDEAMIAHPFRTFDRFFETAATHLGDKGTLIIALDEFETIEDLITRGKIPTDLMAHLRGLVQATPQIAFAFAGLHTLEEMTADYFNPFFASIIPIKVGFLTEDSTATILANPGDPDFPLDYSSAAHRAIWTLTDGQPYLVQLIGFMLVRRYNDLVFEQARPQAPVLTETDVAAIAEDSTFYSRGSNYFHGVWGQAAQIEPHQQSLLLALAPNTNGLTLTELATATNLTPDDILPALDLLEKHDVVTQNAERYYIAVELFRRWVCDTNPQRSNPNA